MWPHYDTNIIEHKSAEHGAMRSTPIQQIEKIAYLQPLECRRESKLPFKGKSWRDWTVIHSTRNFSMEQNKTKTKTKQTNTKNRLKRKSFKHKLKDPQKENADLLEADPGKCEELTTNVWALQKNLPEVRTEINALQQREQRPQNCRKRSHRRWCRIAIPRAPGPTSSQMALQRTLWGIETVVNTSVAQMEPPPPSPSQLVTWAPTTEQKFSCHRTPGWGRLRPAEYCPALWLPVCSSVYHKWPHWSSHPAATQQPLYSVKLQ